MRELVPGDVIAGKYRLERVVGRGGMGAVWAARNEQLGGMRVAMKFIEPSPGTDLVDARARFDREARTAAAIRSPHVAQIIDHGADGDRPFIVMELLEGEDLGDRLRRLGRLSIPAMAKILTQAAKALRRAHEAGIVHRDLKPGNVYLARFDDDEIVKILDFGVAKVQATGAIDEPLATQVGVVFGSPSYMSPEQARGGRVDHRSDLWSLAVIVFRAITGVKPFQAASIGDLVVKLCIDPLPVATTYAPDLPREVDAFFDRAFSREVDQRFSSAVEMAAAFEAVAAAEHAAPVPPVGAPNLAADHVSLHDHAAERHAGGLRARHAHAAARHRARRAAHPAASRRELRVGRDGRARARADGPALAARGAGLPARARAPRRAVAAERLAHGHRAAAPRAARRAVGSARAGAEPGAARRGRGGARRDRRGGADGRAAARLPARSLEGRARSLAGRIGGRAARVRGGAGARAGVERLGERVAGARTERVRSAERLRRGERLRRAERVRRGERLRRRRAGARERRRRGALGARADETQEVAPQLRLLTGAG